MNEPRHLRTSLLASLTLACTTLLGACSLWPLGNSTPVEAATPAVAAPTPCTDCVEGVKPAAVTVAQSPAAPVALSPMPPATAAAEPAAKVAPAPMLAAPKSMATSALVPGFYVNAGLYAVPGNASKAYNKLEGAGLPVFTEIITSKGEQRTRVRVGPYPTRAKADAAAKKIRALKLDAVVFKH